jgi:hypothetical protein
VLGRAVGAGGVGAVLGEQVVLGTRVIGRGDRVRVTLMLRPVLGVLKGWASWMGKAL